MEAMNCYALAKRFTRTRFAGVFFFMAAVFTVRFLAVRAVDLRAEVARDAFFVTVALTGAVV